MIAGTIHPTLRWIKSRDLHRNVANEGETAKTAIQR